MNLLSPDKLMEQIAAALPEECRQNVIIVGSLAAGFHYFAGDAKRSIRTKDVDCMFSPHAKAVAVAGEVTERLLNAQWRQRSHTKWGQPGNKDTPTSELPMIRLQPPEQEFKVDWFLELLGAPDVNAERTKTYYRVATANGDFAICSFNYLALAEWNPLETRYGIRIARPSMMALANMLHHPEIAQDLIAETTNKRSNKDLGRVLALAWLAARKDQEEDTDVLGTWHQEMAEALKFYFPDRAKELATRAGAGISALMSSESDLNEALSICNRGLLASLEVNPNAFLAIGRKFTQMVIDPLAGKAALWS